MSLGGQFRGHGDGTTSAPDGTVTAPDGSEAESPPPSIPSRLVIGDGDPLSARQIVGALLHEAVQDSQLLYVEMPDETAAPVRQLLIEEDRVMLLIPGSVVNINRAEAP